MITYRCITCLWLDREHESLAKMENNWGYCRKHKPIVYMGEDKKYYGGFPILDAEDFCGEHREA